MLSIEVSNASFKSDNYPEHRVNLTRFASTDDSNKTLEFIYEPKERNFKNCSYILRYTVFVEICNIIFLSSQLINSQTLPERVEIKQLFIPILSSGSGGRFSAVLDLKSNTVTLGFITFIDEDKGTFEMEEFPVRNIPFALFNELNKSIDRQMFVAKEN